MPGGKAEEGDKDDADTATREAKEEIGLDPSLVNVVTHLQPFLSKVYAVPSLLLFFSFFNHFVFVRIISCLLLLIHGKFKMFAFVVCGCVCVASSEGDSCNWYTP